MNAKTLLVLAAMSSIIVSSKGSPAFENLSHTDLLKSLYALTEKTDLNIILNNHMKCFLNESPCDPFWKSVKGTIPVILKDACQTCTDYQKKQIKAGLDKYMAKHPKNFEKFLKLYDPDGKYQGQFAKGINK